MNPTLLISILVVAVICSLLLMRFSSKIEKQNVIILNIIAFIVSIGISLFGQMGQSLDVEILNGEVIGKYQETVSCSHSYQCNCKSVTTCTGSGATRSCSSYMQCDTCYEHNHDYNWVVKSNIGNVDIDRIDRQGIHTPPRWTSVKNGEPFASAHMHMNYIKGASNSLFNNQDQSIEKFKNMIPSYPSNVYDYYRINRALSVGVPIPDLQEWSNSISNMLKQLGPQKQANVIVVFANTNDHNYEYALRSSWLGGKKNDVVVIVGTTQYPNIDFVRVMSWTDQEIFKIKLRDALEDLKVIDRDQFIQAISNITQNEFKRKQMKDFEYLDNEIDVPLWVIILSFFIVIAANVVYYWVSIRKNTVNSKFKRKF